MINKTRKQTEEILQIYILSDEQMTFIETLKPKLKANQEIKRHATLSKQLILYWTNCWIFISRLFKY